MNREELVNRIDLTRKAIEFAGPVHARDLRKHLHRMEIELKRYDQYRSRAITDGKEASKPT